MPAKKEEECARGNAFEHPGRVASGWVGFLHLKGRSGLCVAIKFDVPCNVTVASPAEVTKVVIVLLVQAPGEGISSTVSEAE